MKHGIVLVLLTDSAPITPAANDMSQPAGSEGRTREMIALCRWAYNSGSCDKSTFHTLKLINKNCFKTTICKGFKLVTCIRIVQSYLERADVTGGCRFSQTDATSDSVG